MKNCKECNYKFTFLDRIKLILNGKLKCKNCFSEYVPKKTFARFLYYTIIINLNIIYILSSNYFNISYFGVRIFHQKLFLSIFINTTLLISYDLFFYKFQSYKKIN